MLNFHHDPDPAEEIAADVLVVGVTTDGDDLRPNARVDRAETAAWLYRLDRL